MVIDETYSDEVVQILTNGIGFILGRAIRKNYYELKDKLGPSPYFWAIDNVRISL